MSAAKCPMCGRPVDPTHRPFCSARCADLDLHRWLGGHYAIPGSEDPDSSGEEPDGD